MHPINHSLTPARYAALQKTQELMLLAGGTAKTPEEYAAFVLDAACDSYAAQYTDNTVEGLAAQLVIQKDAVERAQVEAEDAKSRVATMTGEKS